MAIFPFMSVAVVTTGTAPMCPATLTAMPLAPPMCPDRMGMQNLPSSSTEMTAGSTVLFLMKGAISLTAMPTAPTKTMASHSAKDLSVHSLMEHSTFSMPTESAVVLANRFTSSSGKHPAMSNDF